MVISFVTTCLGGTLQLSKQSVYAWHYMYTDTPHHNTHHTRPHLTTPDTHTLASYPPNILVFVYYLAHMILSSIPVSLQNTNLLAILNKNLKVKEELWHGK